MSNEEKIAQFKQMAEADPGNELGHFSLGKAYLEAGRFQEASASLEQSLTLNPKLSKAYQLLGEAYEKAGQRDESVKVLTRGSAVADELGDHMPRDAMADMLRKAGADVPSFKAVETPAAAHAGDATASGFQCSRCGRPAGKMEKAPIKGKFGEKIFANVCQSCWQEWIPMGTKVINELGLALASPEGSEAYDQYMVEFLQLDGR